MTHPVQKNNKMNSEKRRTDPVLLTAIQNHDFKTIIHWGQQFLETHWDPMLRELKPQLQSHIPSKKKVPEGPLIAGAYLHSEPLENDGYIADFFETSSPNKKIVIFMAMEALKRDMNHGRSPEQIAEFYQFDMLHEMGHAVMNASENLSRLKIVQDIAMHTSFSLTEKQKDDLESCVHFLDEIQANRYATQRLPEITGQELREPTTKERNRYTGENTRFFYDNYNQLPSFLQKALKAELLQRGFTIPPR